MYGHDTAEIFAAFTAALVVCPLLALGLHDTTGMASPAPQEIARIPIDDVYRKLETSPNGLTSSEAEKRLRQYGPNRLHTAARTAWPLRLLRQATHFLALLLWIAAGLAILAEVMNPGSGMFTLALAIVAVIAVNALFAFAQEFRAERAVDALHDLLPTTTWVIREGRPQQVARHDIVPGDLLLIEEGERLPADGRLVEALAMRVDLASLTGEARPKARTTHIVSDGHLLDLPNLVFAGTTILSGHGRAVVYATGMDTEFGKLAGLATTLEPGLSPLQLEMVKVTRMIAVFALVMGGLFFILGISMNLGFWVSAVFGIGIIAANVPEGLLPTMTLALALGSQRMAKRNALIKHLSSVETLGCTTVICTDKTGTLTENRMRVERVHVDGLDLEARNGLLVIKDSIPNTIEPSQLGPIAQALSLCHTAKRVRQAGGRSVWVGDPTEVALLEFVDAYGLSPPAPPQRLGELPFDADRKRMTTLHWMAGQLVAHVKGAPETVIPLCSRAYDPVAPVPMSDAVRQELLTHSRRLAQQAYRVLAVAVREIERTDVDLDSKTVEQDLVFLGLVAMIDPPHREVPGAVARCRTAGVRVVMLTGDHPLTAVALARKIGLLPGTLDPSKPELVPVIEGTRVEVMNDAELQAFLTPARPGETEPLFARMAPRHKMRVVSMLKRMGEIVAVTGDGVNDAPALKQADIGIAMGIAGTDVAKETADMILLDDNFATIVNAIEEGRAVYANIKKFTTYVLASNVPEIVPFLGYGMVGLPLAITVPQILAVDLGTDMLPALALGAERPDPGLMNVPPRARSARLVDRSLMLRAYGFLGLIEAALAMGAFFGFLYLRGWEWGVSLNWSDPLYQEATTVTLATIVVAQVANVFACRSARQSALRLGFATNALLFYGIAAELALLLAIVYLPALHVLFGTKSLPMWIWPALAGGAVFLLMAEELRKLLLRRRHWLDGRAPSPPHTHIQEIVRKESL
ncbi:ATPase [Nitrospira sp.]|nr:ATPase [Nitrospira sp.]